MVLPTPIPDKGKVLTGLSRFWFDETSGLVANHLLSTDLDDVDPIDRPRVATDGRRVDADDLRGRVMLCRRVDVLPVEVIVRGYLAGSGAKDYASNGAIAGIELPSGLREGDRLPEPILTPSTKAELGRHDETITFDVPCPEFERSSLMPSTVLAASSITCVIEISTSSGEAPGRFVRRCATLVVPSAGSNSRNQISV